MKFKRGVKRGVLPSTAYWMGKLESRFLHWFGEEPTCTSAFREFDPGAHGQGEAWDIRRIDKTDEEFARRIQDDFGAYVGVVLEPEWGQGAGFTGAHFHFQTKPPGKRGW